MKGNSNRTSQIAMSSIRRFTSQGFSADSPSMTAQFELRDLYSHLPFLSSQDFAMSAFSPTKFQFSRCFNASWDCNKPNSVHSNLKSPETKH